MDIQQLNKLTELKAKGAITAEEFEVQKQILLQQESNAGGDKSLWEYFVLCLTDKYFCFSGRARRKEYWSFVLFHYLIGILISGINDFLTMHGGNTRGIEILGTFVTIALFVPGIAALCRRLHDVNFTGLWLTLPIFALFSIGFLFGYHNSASDGYHLGISTKFMAQDGMALILVALLFICMLSILFIMILTLLKSQMKINKYGPIPAGVR